MPVTAESQGRPASAAALGFFRGNALDKTLVVWTTGCALTLMVEAPPGDMALDADDAVFGSSSARI
jgi:hypothetical protein